MKPLLISILSTMLLITACKEEEPKKRDEIPFKGVWQRQFEAGPGNLHTVQYFIYEDSIRYTISGPIGNANYLMKRDKFLLKENRFIGHTEENQHYLIFVKDIQSGSLSIYKQKVDNVTQGMNTEIPSPTTTANHGWNTFYKP